MISRGLVAIARVKAYERLQDKKRQKQRVVGKGKKAMKGNRLKVSRPVSDGKKSCTFTPSLSLPVL
jgi:hypothetical protein